MKKIMFNDQYGLTKAVLDGRKTQTRRIVKDVDLLQELNELEDDGVLKGFRGKIVAEDNAQYKVGEVVAIAQSYKSIMEEDLERGVMGHPTVLEQNASATAGWNNKMFVKARSMPHHIRITDVRIERLQDISDEDCIAEGITQGIRRFNNGETVFYKFENKDNPFVFSKAREAYAALIDKISGKATWNANPFVFVYGFELIK